MLGIDVLSHLHWPLASPLEGRREATLPTFESDEDLALRLQKGDVQALDDLAGRHHALLLGYLYRMTGGDRPLAEDLVQEAFVRVLRGIHRYTHPRPFKPWLYTIATNLARDHYRQAEQRRTQSMPDDYEAASEDAVDDGLLAAAEARQVAQALLGLPAHQRETVVLRYYQDLSLAEIAEALNIPVGTVKSRLSLGLQRLRELLA